MTLPCRWIPVCIAVFSAACGRTPPGLPSGELPANAVESLVSHASGGDPPTPTDSTRESCPCRGDMNGDGRRDAADIQGFTAAFFSSPADGASACRADMDRSLGLDAADVARFADCLVGLACDVCE
jgi:hypothetical protein